MQKSRTEIVILNLYNKVLNYIYVYDNLSNELRSMVLEGLFLAIIVMSCYFKIELQNTLCCIVFTNN